MGKKNKEKKHPERFHIRFSITGPYPDPDHVDAVDTLNALDDGQIAGFLARAIASYKKLLASETACVLPNNIATTSRKTKGGSSQPKTKQKKIAEPIVKFVDEPQIESNLESGISQQTERVALIPTYNSGEAVNSTQTAEEEQYNDQIEEEELGEIMDALEAFSF